MAWKQSGPESDRKPVVSTEKTCKEKPGKQRQLIEAIIKSWFHVIRTEDLGNLENSVPRRIGAVIKNNGYPTKY